MATYKELLVKATILERQLQDMELKAVLAALAKIKSKSRYVRDLESRLELELQTHHRLDRIKTLLEMLMDDESIEAVLVL